MLVYIMCALELYIFYIKYTHAISIKFIKYIKKKQLYIIYTYKVYVQISFIKVKSLNQKISD